MSILLENTETYLKSEQIYRTFLESASEGIVITNEQGKIEIVNRKTEELFGYRRDELLGQSIEFLLPEQLRRGHRKQRLEYLKNPQQRPMGKGRELSARRKDGSEFPVEVSLSPVKVNGRLVVMAFITDISIRKEIEHALRDEKEKAQRYLDIAGVMIIVVNRDRTVRLVNKKGCEVLGYREEEIVGKNWFSHFVPQRIRNEIQSVFEQLMSGEIELVEYFTNPVLTRSGEERIIAWQNAVFRNEDGEITGTLSSGEDITERVLKEEQAKKQQQQLIQADKMATLGILVSGVAHEINNPASFILLNGKIFSRVWKDISGILQTYYEENGDFAMAGMPYTRAYEKIAKLITGVSEGAERIERIVKSLKDFARQDTGEIDQEVNLNDVVESAIVIVHNLIKKSTDNFSVDLTKDMPLIQGNFQQLEQIVINLLTNACQAIPDPERALKVSTRFNREEKKVVLEVTDEGEGIDPEHLKHIMDPFFTTKQDSGGTGLGLSICYNIAKEHGGGLEFRSIKGKGTVATLMLPV